MDKYAVIVAGGSGQRMGAAVPKQFLLLQGKSLLWHSVNAFVEAFADIHIILVLPPDHIAEGETLARSFLTIHPVLVTAGGATRFHSVQNGLQLVREPSIVFVHDAVRCLVTPSLIRSCYTQALEKGSAVPAVAATDSIRIVEGEKSRVADRNLVRIIQTPQTFRSDRLLPAYAVAYDPVFTDEATVVEAAGGEVFLSEGEYTNIKITHPVDLLTGERILAARSSSV